jgi:hypothetical protein
MAIVLEGTATLYESSSTTSAVLTYPSSPASGEILVAVLGTSTVTAPTSAPAGWTLAHAQNGNNAISGSIFYKISDGTESGTVTFTGMSGRTTGHMFRLSGVDNTTPIDVTGVGAGAPIQTTFDMPSITTATNNAMLIHGIVLNASNRATNDINTLSGTTLIGLPTGGLGRITGAYYEERATAGATGTRTWTKTGATALQWAGATVAFKPAAGGTSGDVTAVVMTATATAIAPAVSDGNSGNVAAVVATADATMYAPVITAVPPTLVQRVVGIPATNTTTSGVVQVKTTLATSVRLKCSTDSAGTTGVVWGSPVTPDADGNSRLTVTGLTAGTRYYYRVAMTYGTEVLDTEANIGRLRTAPASAANFAFNFGSCTNNTDSNAIGAIATRDDDLFFHLGDLYYADASGTTTANFRSKMNAKITATNHQAVFRQTNMSYTPSDHDGMNNNVNAGNDATAWANWNTARAELFPMSASYYSFMWGRVKFIQLDTRSFASDPAATDNSSKSLLGTTQKQWLKDEIDASTAVWTVIVQGDPWITSAAAGGDTWDGFITERDELAAYFSNSTNGKKSIAMIGGDMHAIAADNGTNAPGGITVFHGSPFYQNASIKGGPYSVGPYPASGSAVVEQYGRVAVTDDGLSCSLAFTGYSADNTVRATLTETAAMVAAPCATATATAVAPTVGVIATVQAVAATATADTVAPAVTAAATVLAVVATATASAPAPAVGGDAAVAAVLAPATADAPAPAVTAAAVVVGVVATATTDAVAPAVTAAATVAAVCATATADAIAPAVSAGGVADVAAVAMTATADALAPAVGGDALVVGTLATATADAVAPVVTAAATVAAVVATATADALAPIVTAAGEGVVSVPAATADADMVAPAVTSAATIAAVCATATADATAPVVTAAVDIAAVCATATADALAPAVTAGAVTEVLALAAAATAEAIAPVVTSAAVIAAVVATATALAQPPAVAGDVAVVAVVATASAVLLAPTVTAAYVAYVPTSTALMELWAPSVTTIAQADIVLAGEPLAARWTREPLGPKYRLQEWPDRYTGRPDEGDRMAVEVLASAGAVKFVGGTVTETSGLDISTATFEMSLGSATDPGATWYSPDVSSAGDSNAERVLKLKVSATLPSGITVPGTYWCWARITDASEVEPVRLQGPITVR